MNSDTRQIAVCTNGIRNHLGHPAAGEVRDRYADGRVIVELIGLWGNAGERVVRELVVGEYELVERVEAGQ